MKTNRVNHALVGALVAVFIVAGNLQAASRSEVIFTSMQDELQRSMSDLVIEQLERPYFLSYTIDDFQELRMIGCLGELAETKLDQTRYVTVDLRVGDWILDNANFASGFNLPGPNYRRITFDDDYDAIRNQIYLATDQAYKDALKMVSKKRAFLQTRVIKNRPADHIKLPANQYRGSEQKFDLAPAQFEPQLRAGSKVFRDYPMIISSRISLVGAVINQYFLNSTGSKALRGDRLYRVELTMTGKGPDDEDIFDRDQIIVTDLKEFPGTAQLTSWAKDNAERMKAMIKAKAVEEYVGPVILTGDAAGELFRQLFAKHVANSPLPLCDNEQMEKMLPEIAFANKLKRRVLPDFFNVYDDPTIGRLGDLKLIGGYGVDDAGGIPVRVQLVDKGKLINLLIGTAPTRKVTEPNGHARGAVGSSVTARPANLIFESTDQVPYEQLKKTLIELCQDSDLEYGLIITRLGDPSSPRRISFYFGGGQGARESQVSAPIEIYKVYADGREEPVHSLEFGDVTVRILRDILQTSDQQYAYNYLTGGDYELPVTVICPAVLVEEMELKKSEEKTKTGPILPSPLAGR